VLLLCCCFVVDVTIFPSVVSYNCCVFLFCCLDSFNVLELCVFFSAVVVLLCCYVVLLLMLLYFPV
jgi:hypothetical protein